MATDTTGDLLTLEACAERARVLGARCASGGLPSAEYHLGMAAERLPGGGAFAIVDLALAWSSVLGARDGLRMAAHPAAPDPALIEWLTALAESIHVLRLQALRLQ